MLRWVALGAALVLVGGWWLPNTVGAQTNPAPSPSSTTTTDPDLGRQLQVHPADPEAKVVQDGPLWIGTAVALSGAAAIAYSLAGRPARRRRQTWPRRR